MPKSVCALIWLVFLAFACGKDKPEPVLILQDEDVLVLCEGNFNRGDGEIFVYSPRQKEVKEGVYTTANGFGPGNVLQSYFEEGGEGYLIVNNSHKIERLNPVTLKRQAANRSLISPRYAALYGNRLFVTDLYAGYISVLDAKSLGEVARIKAPGWTEKIIVLGNKLLAANRRTDFDPSEGGENLLVIDPDRLVVTDSLKLGYGLEEVIAFQGRIWLAYDSLLTGEKYAVVTLRDNLTNPQVVASFDQGPKPARLCHSEVGSHLYFLHQGVRRIHTASFQADVLWQAPRRNLNGLAVAEGDSIYLSDAGNYAERGQLLCGGIGLNGSLLLHDSVRVGVIPGNLIIH